MNPVIALVTSRIGPPLGLSLVRLLPAEAARRLAEGLAAAAVRLRGSPVLEAIRGNQAVVRNLPLNHPALELAVREVCGNAARSYLTLYRSMALGRAALTAACPIEANVRQWLDSASAIGRGVVVAGAHMGSFDTVFLSMQERGLSPQVLSYPNPRGSYRADNAIRRRYGLDLTPISPAALRTAIRRLQQGGSVLTGIDRPDRAGEWLEFFGRLAQLPVGHARLAQRTGSLLFVVACVDDGMGAYKIVGAPPLEPSRATDARTAARRLAQKALNVLERFIGERPGEWLMFFPVWGTPEPPVS